MRPCANCRTPFRPKRPWGRHCSPSCRAEASRKRRPWARAVTPEQAAAVIGARLSKTAKRPPRPCRADRCDLYLDAQCRRRLAELQRAGGYANRSAALRALLMQEITVPGLTAAPHAGEGSPPW